MFSAFKINLRRITTVFLISLTLFLGMALNLGNTSYAVADVVTRASSNAELDDTLNQAEYEAAKAKRQQKQALRSKQAEQDNDNETIKEKLNLDEPLPASTKEFIEQIKGDEPGTASSVQ